MEFKEIKNNFYQKEISSTERYLLRIIKRYFDIEELNNAASINAIITEAIARYKQSIRYEVADVLSINDKVGIVNLSIKDLNGELLFDKLTAFNKDFGIEPDTICEGDDIRLSDKREPNYHHHNIKDIDNLRKTLDDLIKEMIKYSNHIHVNMAILNKIIYTRNKTSIDLIELESFDGKIIILINELLIANAKLRGLITKNKDNIEDLLRQVNFFIIRLQEYIKDFNIALENEIKKYIDSKIKTTLNSIIEDLFNYANKTSANLLIDTLNDSYFYVNRQEFDLVTELNLIKEDISSGESLRDMYDTSIVVGMYNGVTNYYDQSQKEYYYSFDNALNTFIANFNISEYIMFLSNNLYQNYIHEVTMQSDNSDNDAIGVVIAATEINGEMLTLSLIVHTTGVPGSQFAIQYNYPNFDDYELASDSTFITESGWSIYPNGIRVRIVKNENIITVYRSEMNDSIISETPCIILDLNESEMTKPFLGPCKYGYGCLSQLNSKFLDVSFVEYNKITLSNILNKEKDIDTSLLSNDYIIDTMEIEPEFIYNNTKTKLPYITNSFIINSGKTSDNKIFVSFQPLALNVEIPMEISKGKIAYNIYAKRKNIPYLI